MDFGKIIEQAHDIHQQVLRLNMSCSKLNGVAATVPAGAPFPISHFIGTKIILRNVRYNFERCSVTASVKLPYRDKGNACEHSGKTLEFAITEDWLK